MALMTQSELDDAHDMLDALIKTALCQANACCNAKDGENRDLYNAVASRLLDAKSIAGGITAGGIQPKFGGK